MIKAGPGSCVCKCPNCGCSICLSIGPSGYDTKAVARTNPSVYAALAQVVHGEDMTIDVYGDFVPEGNSGALNTLPEPPAHPSVVASAISSAPSAMERDERSKVLTTNTFAMPPG